MIETLIIDILHANDNDFFRLNGDINALLKNKRLLITLERLGYESMDDYILVPYSKESQPKVLDDIKRLLEKNDIVFDFSTEVNRELKSYEREEEKFSEFSENARSIRDNEFKKNPKLIQLFDSFQTVLKKEMNRELYPLQLLSSFHMAFANNSCNFAVPGAGKTSIVYGAYSFLKQLPEDDPRRIDRLMIIGPLSSFAPWENEYEECFGKKPISFRMSGDIEITNEQKLRHLYSGNPAELTLIFHGGVDKYKNDILDFLKRNKTMLVVDEAHRIKNPEGIWGRSVTEISKEARSRVILTGTPVPNGYQDLFNLYKFIYPYKYKEILDFHYHNLEDMTYNNSIDSSRVQKLKENISPYFIRIKKKDLGLPPIEEKTIVIEMDAYQREIYDFIESDYIETFKDNYSGTVKDVLNKARLIRLRQASTNPLLLSKPLKDSLENNFISGEFDPNAVFTTDTDQFINDAEFFDKILNYHLNETPAKYKEVLKLLNDEIVTKGDKAIIWTIFIQNAKELQTFLSNNKIESKLLIGEISQQERELTIKAFNDPNNKDFQVVIANPFSVAESISLHKGCHNAIYLERDYNCSNFIQSKDRIHRVGLPKEQITKYYYIISQDSVDEVINNRLQEKILRMEAIINDDIPLFTSINDNDETDIIKDLLLNYAKRS